MSDIIVRSVRTVFEEVTAAFKRAGLICADGDTRLDDEPGGATLCVSASRAGWPHSIAMLEVQTRVEYDGRVGKVQVVCQATDSHPGEAIWQAHTVRNAVFNLAELPSALRVILRERDAIVAEAAEAARWLQRGRRRHWWWRVPTPAEMLNPHVRRRRSLRCRRNSLGETVAAPRPGSFRG